jgi:hypothetical protein
MSNPTTGLRAQQPGNYLTTTGPGQGTGSVATTLLNRNTQKFLWAQQVKAQTLGFASVAVKLYKIPGAFYPDGYSIEVAFSGDPGAFELDIQHADTDFDGYYVTIASISSVNASFVGRNELPNISSRFVRVYMKTLTNDVTTTVQISR